MLARLGIGGMGAVYAGVERNIDKKVAIKVVHPHVNAIPELPTLLAEAKAVNAIGDRGIVDVHGFGALPDGRQYLVMELLEGESLDALIRRKRRLDLAELLALGDGILGALEAAHHAGFVHRDIKPANVFVVRPQRGEPFVKLLDFGLAQRSRVASRLALGTPAYAAPEQVKAGAALGPAADLYSVGCVLFEAATGHPPFDGPDTRTVVQLAGSADRPSVRKQRPELPPAFDALLVSLMAIDASARPASASAARAALKAMAPKRRSWAWAVAAAALALAAGTGAWVATRPEPETRVTIPADPLEAATKRFSWDVRRALDQRQWPQVFERLGAAERAFPKRKEWEALRGEARAAVRLEATDALERGDLAAAEAALALDPPGDQDPLAKELQRAELARKYGMVRAGGVYIDAYEHPNRAGAQPTVKVDWKDAVKLCATAGKRLCTEDEWQRACIAGSERLGAAKCHRKGKLKVAMPAGAMERCATTQGVHDLFGNVAEWTATAVREGAPQKVIRGGSFGQSDSQLSCTARDYYLPGQGGAKHIGFRCCL